MKSLKSFLRPLWNSSFVFWLRGVWFNLSEKVLDYPIERKRFLEHTGYALDLKNPRSFSDHLVWKKVYDRNPVLPIIADKYRVREYLKQVLGEKDGNDILIPLLYKSTDPKTIPWDDLEGEYIIKANHNSGPNFIVENGDVVDREKIIQSLQGQLRLPYGTLKHEWAYGQIKERRIVVERLLRDEEGKIPKDYKFHMIGGECAFVQIDFNRFTHHTRSLYDKDWKFIPNTTLKFEQGTEDAPPKKFKEMLALAERLSKDFDYIRVDLYNVGDKIYFGEMTHYPGSGMEKFTPIEYDFDLARYWKKYGNKN